MDPASRTRLGALSLVAGLLLATQPLVHALHFLTVDHFWCPEHHQLAHGRAASSGSGEGHSPRDGAVSATAAGAGLAGDHHPCPHPTSDRRDQVVGAERGPGIALCEGLGSAVHIGLPPEPQAPLLALAPKLSPPPARAS